MFCSKNGVKSAHGTLTDIVVLSLYPGKRPSREFSSVQFGAASSARLNAKKKKKNNWEKCRTQRCRQQSVGLGRCARKMLGKSVGKLTIWQRLTSIVFRRRARFEGNDRNFFSASELLASPTSYVTFIQVNRIKRPRLQ